MRRQLAAAGLVALLTACSVEVSPPPGPQAHPFELERLGDTPVRLEDLRGRLVLVDFWATWCPPCVLEIPELNAFYAAHRENGVDLLAIAIDAEDPAALAEWTAERGVQYPVALGDVSLARLYGAEQFPFHLLISREGRILERLTPGYHDRDELAELIARHTQ